VANLGCPYCGGGAGSGLTAHDPNSCKMKPTGFDTGSELMGYQSALAVSDTDPSADVDAMLEKLRTEVQTHRADEDFIVPQTGFDVVLPTSSRLPKDLLDTSRILGSSFGLSKEKTSSLVDRVALSLGLNRDTKLVPADEAAEAVSKVMNWAQDSSAASQELVDKVRRGDIVLTGSEIAVLQGVRDEIFVMQNPDLGELAADGGWAPPFEQRNCTLCGQFVGELGSHNCAGGGNKAWELMPYKKLKERKIVVERLDSDGNLQESKKPIKCFREIDSLSSDQQKDIILSGGDASGAIIFSYYEKPLIGKAKITLPEELREAFLAKPVPEHLYAVVQAIDPPLKQQELERIMDVCGNSRNETHEFHWAVTSLLSSPRVGKDVLEHLENNPSHVGGRLAREGGLPDRSIAAMASSGDPAVRKQAVGAKNLRAEDLERLATDPDPSIREIIVFRDWGHNSLQANPHLLTTFVNDPEESLALRALQIRPYSRQAMQALGAVTSRRRLQAIHDALPKIWDPDDRVVRDFTEGPRREAEELRSIIASVQEAIRARL